MGKKPSDTTLTTPQAGDYIPIERSADTTARHITTDGLLDALLGGDASTNTIADESVSIGAGNSSTGQYSVAIGGSNTTLATGAIAIGLLCQADLRSLATGYYSRTRVLNQRAHGAYLGSLGDAQFSEYHLARQTLNATPATMAVASEAKITIPSGAVFTFHAYVSAATSGAAKAGAWIFYGAIRNAGGTTALMGSVTKLFESETDAGWDVAITADDTNDELVITVTGAASTTIRWKATVLVNEMTFA